MKQILLLLTVLISSISFAQDTANYLKVEGKDLIWEKVYEMPGKSAEEIKALLAKNVATMPKTYGYDLTGDVITVMINGFKFDTKHYGLKWATSPVVLFHYQYGKVSIVWKDDKYKVTITDLMANTEDHSISGAGKGAFAAGGIVSRYDGLIRKGEIRNKSKAMRTISIVLSQEYSRMFDFTKEQDSDW